MRKSLLGGIAAILMLCGGVFLWQGIGQTADAAPVVAPPPPPPEGLPVAATGQRGAALPDVPTATPASREERRFWRYDRNRDGTITRVEMLSTRTAAFRRLDRDGNNLLSFEEWAVATSNRFAGADADRSGGLTAREFAATAPVRKPKAACACAADSED